MTRRAAVSARAAALALALVLPLSAAMAADVTVFAAASLKDALDEIVADYETREGVDVTVSLAGSSALARQIEAGAPADVFISASVLWMDVLEDAGLLAEGTRRDLVGNRLVLVAHGRDAAPLAIDEAFDLPALIGEERLAMALVEAVPAGIYGKAALTSLDQWDALAPKVAQLDNVRAALALVARGETPYGIVYATDASAEDNVTVVATFPEALHPPIVYPAAVVEGAGELARAFLDHLSSDTARTAFERQGFSVLP